MFHVDSIHHRSLSRCVMSKHMGYPKERTFSIPQNNFVFSKSVYKPCVIVQGLAIQYYTIYNITLIIQGLTIQYYTKYNITLIIRGVAIHYYTKYNITLIIQGLAIQYYTNYKGFGNTVLHKLIYNCLVLP